MAKLSLLDMTQSILSAMDSDPVSSIDETVESIQVADLIKEAFFELVTLRDWPFLHTLTTLTGLSDTNNPTKMLIPDGLNKVKWIKVNKKEIEWLPPEQFQHMLDTRTAEAGVVNSNGYVLNRDPLYWTSYDDKYVFFDGWDSNESTTITTAMTTVYDVKVAQWTHVDSFIPDIPEKFFPTLLAEAKSQAFVNLKQLFWNVGNKTIYQGWQLTIKLSKSKKEQEKGSEISEYRIANLVKEGLEVTGEFMIPDCATPSRSYSFIRARLIPTTNFLS